MKILITGPAGYIGCKLVPMLLKQNHQVIGFDNLTFGYHTLLPHLGNKNFKFVYGDVTKIEKHKNLFEEIDGIIHLAAIVGFPACHKNPELAESVNLDATRKIADLKKKETFMIYASTCSNYGHRGTDLACDENAPLAPLTEYGVTKTESEKYVLSKKNTTALRIATAFGMSPRLRLDLLLNNFVIKAIQDKKIDIYESFHRRSFIHVTDIARAFCFAIENLKTMQGSPYNVGSKKLNFTKMQLAKIIQKHVDCEIIEGKGSDSDQRDYVIDFNKINKIGFDCEVLLDDGISEAVESLRYLIGTGEFEKFKNFYKNI
jgi:nucleoside-diphosphate-sugar epimerase